MDSKPTTLLGKVSSDTSESREMMGFSLKQLKGISSTSKHQSQTPPASLFIFKNPEKNSTDEVPLKDEPRSDDRLLPPRTHVDEANITNTLETSSKSVSTENLDKAKSESKTKQRIKKEPSKKSVKKSTKNINKAMKVNSTNPQKILQELETPKNSTGKYYEVVKEAILNDQSMRSRIFEASANALKIEEEKLNSTSKISTLSVQRKASVTSKTSTKRKPKKVAKESHIFATLRRSLVPNSKKRASSAGKNDPKTVKVKYKNKTSSQVSIPPTNSLENTTKKNTDNRKQNPNQDSSQIFDVPGPETIILSPPPPFQNNNDGTAISDSTTNPAASSTKSSNDSMTNDPSSLLKNVSKTLSSPDRAYTPRRNLSSTSSKSSKKSKLKKDKRSISKKGSTSSISSTHSKSSRKSKTKSKSKVPKKVSSTRSDNNSRKEKKQPQVHELLSSCESYMNWSHRLFSTEILRHYISEIELMYLEPPPTGEYIKNETLRYGSLECIANLGALCFFHIECNQFQAAKDVIDKTKDFVDESMQKGFLNKEFIYSLDYVWDFLRLYASNREWTLRNQFTYFPEMNLYGFTLSLESLKPKVKAGIFGIKAYYLSLIEVSFDRQIETLRKAINFDHECSEWHCCLQRVLRQRRKSNARQSLQPKFNYSIEDELQESSTAVKLSPHHPRCILGAMQVLTDMATIENSGFKWHNINFGSQKFTNVASVVRFLKDEAKKVMKHLPQSVDANLILADIFLVQLPKGFRDPKLGKECLDRCLLHHPESAKTNLRIAQFHLNVDKNYGEAEMFFDTAFSLDGRNYTALTGLLYCMMRTLVKRQDVILDLIKKQLKKNHWHQKQLATLRYLRGLTLFGTSKPSEAFEEFLRAYKMDENSIAFHELPDIHKHFGWPGWPITTILNFGNLRIEAEVFKEELTNSNHEEDAKMLMAIIKAINKADNVDKQHKRSRKRNLSNKGSSLSSRTISSLNAN